MSIVIFVLEMLIILTGFSFWILTGICMFREKESTSKALKVGILCTGAVAFGIFLFGILALAFLK